MEEPLGVSHTFDKSNLASKVRMVMQYWDILYDPITDPFCSNGLVFSGGGEECAGQARQDCERLLPPLFLQ